MMDDYNSMLSRAFGAARGKFAAVASPTLNKQETITFLYERVLAELEAAGSAQPLASGFALRLEFFARLALKFLSVLVCSLRFRVRALPSGAVYVRTWLVPRSFGNGEIVDDYFRRLLPDLRASGPLVVAFQPMRVADYFLGFGGRKHPADFVISPGLLRTGDVRRLFSDYVRTARVRLAGPQQFRGRNVTETINRSLDLDYFKLRSFQAYLDRYVTERLTAFAPKAFVYVFENQGWEKACLGALANTGTKAIGYQSSGFSDRFLNFFPSNQDASQQRYPAVILTVGELFARVMLERGCYPVPVEPFAATRFDYPVSNGRYEVSAPRPEVLKRILYALAVHSYQYPRIIRELTESFGGSEVEVVLKFHPVYGDRHKSLSLPSNFKVWSPEREPIRDRYDAVLFNDNSYGFESLLQGVKAFEYRCEAVYDETRLYDFDIYDCVLDRSRLDALRDSIVGGTFEKTYPVDRVEEYLNAAFKPYSRAAFDHIAGIISAA